MPEQCLHIVCSGAKLWVHLTSWGTCIKVSALILTCFQGLRGFRVGCRGSTGFGEDSIQSLPGHVSVNDVEDCIAALDHAVTEGGILAYLQLSRPPCYPGKSCHQGLISHETYHQAEASMNGYHVAFCRLIALELGSPNP